MLRVRVRVRVSVRVKIKVRVSSSILPYCRSAGPVLRSAVSILHVAVFDRVVFTVLVPTTGRTYDADILWIFCIILGF